MKEKMKFLFPILLNILIVLLLLYFAINTRDKAFIYPVSNVINQRDLLDVVNHNHTI